MRYFLLLCVLTMAFCQREMPDNQLLVSVEKIALRAAPGLKSAEMAVLRRGEKLTDLGVVGAFESEIAFDAAPLRRPWIKVKTAAGKEGWVFAGAVQPKGDPEAWLLQKRLDCYFGHAFSLRLNAWKASLDALPTDVEFAAAYRTAIALRDSIDDVFTRRAEPNGAPDYQWLDGLMPGFVYQRGHAGGPPDLFADYRFWFRKALQTSGASDEAFLEICCMAFPVDSIESFFPVWKFQLSETESASQLGTGVHLKMLQKIDATRAKTPLFDPELLRLKDAVLEDIQDKNTQFWQSKYLILKELDDLIDLAPACLTDKERSALQPRRVMLEAAEANGIVVDLRSGGGDGVAR